MKRSIYRNTLFLVLFALSVSFVAGCQSNKMGDKPGDEMNSAMTEKQKSILAEHKKKADQ